MSSYVPLLLSVFGNAFANSEGGDLLFGIRDDARIVGMPR